MSRAPAKPRDQEIADLKAHIESLRTQLATAISEADQWARANGAHISDARQARKECDGERERRQAAELMLERAKGYIDRVAERDECEDALKGGGECAPVPRGPSLNGSSGNGISYFDARPGSTGPGRSISGRRY